MSRLKLDRAAHPSFVRRLALEALVIAVIGTAGVYALALIR